MCVCCDPIEQESPTPSLSRPGSRSPRLPWIIIISVVQSCSPVPCPADQWRCVVLQHFHNRNQFIIIDTSQVFFLFSFLKRKTGSLRACRFWFFACTIFPCVSATISGVLFIFSLTWRRFNVNMKPVGLSLSVWFILCAILVASSRSALAQKGHRSAKGIFYRIIKSLIRKEGRRRTDCLMIDLPNFFRILRLWRSSMESPFPSIIHFNLHQNFWFLECPNGEFKCNNNQCISQSQKCDRYDDCPNGEDEDNCVYGKLFLSLYFYFIESVHWSDEQPSAI